MILHANFTSYLTVAQPTVPLIPPASDRPVFLNGTVAFDDALTRRHYNKNVCFRQASGWPMEGSSSNRQVRSRMIICD